MSSDLRTSNQQDQELDSSEQYAINAIGDRILRSADLVIKESKRAVENATNGKPAPQKVARRQGNTSPRPTGRNYAQAKPEDLSHTLVTDNNLRLGEETSLTTWENSAVTNSLHFTIRRLFAEAFLFPWYTRGGVSLKQPK